MQYPFGFRIDDSRIRFADEDVDTKRFLALVSRSIDLCTIVGVACSVTGTVENADVFAAVDAWDDSAFLGWGVRHVGRYGHFDWLGRWRVDRTMLEHLIEIDHVRDSLLGQALADAATIAERDTMAAFLGWMGHGGVEQGIAALGCDGLQIDEVSQVIACGMYSLP